MDITYRVNSTSVGEICRFLWNCNDDFIPILSQRVNIEEYSTKIFTNATRFEAWDNGILVGVVAMYANNPPSGYITSVSVRREYTSFGIASNLMKECVDYARNFEFTEIRLEVNTNNTPAIRLYGKYGFKIYDKKNDSEFMHLKFVDKIVSDTIYDI